MTRILGIDPGSRVTGFGIIDYTTHGATYLASGCVDVVGVTLADKLKVIFEHIIEVIGTYQPNDMAVEQVFMHRNAASALKLGQARGAALLAGVTQQLAVYEYTPAQVKQAVTGKGNCQKEQVQHMIKVLLNLQVRPRSDAADALAVALCHGNIHATRTRFERMQVRTRGVTS